MNQVAKQDRPHPMVVVREQLEARVDQFAAGLPAHIPVERFVRVVLTAIENNPDLLKCDRASLFTAAKKAAQDGLLPDGREGAIVPYKGEAQWMPMIAGIRKKVRNSGEIATWDVQAVYEKDEFEFELGDEPYIKHRPCLDADRGKLKAVYSVAKLKDGSISRDVMSVHDVEKIRAKSRAKNGPWNDATFYPEMAKKTVARRHSKVLPMSSDLDDLIRRDDALYDFKGRSDEQARQPRPALGAALDRLAGPSGDDEAEDEGNGTVIDNEPEGDRDDDRGGEDRDEPDGDDRGDDNSDEDDGDAEGERREQTPVDVAYDRGWAAKERGMARKAVPTEYRDDARRKEADAWLKGYDDCAKEGGK